MLDVYSPTSAATEESPTILLFFYGGGLERGDKVMHQSNDLTYTNLGYFFSQKLNLLTVIMNYRQISERVRFPSSGEDVAAAAEWVKSKYGAGSGPPGRIPYGKLGWRCACSDIHARAEIRSLESAHVTRHCWWHELERLHPPCGAV